MSMAAYQDDPCPVPSLSAGLVRILTDETPAHAWQAHPRLNPDYKESAAAENMDIGSAAHALLFEGADNMQVIEADDFRTKAAREQRDDARASGKFPILARKYSMVQAVVASAKAAWDRNEDLAGYRLADGKPEQTIVWNEAESWFRCRPDWMSNDRKIIIDGKFTETSAHPNAYARQIANMGYDSRGAFYLRGNTATGSAEDAVYVFLVCEIQPPYACAFIGLPPAYVALGASKVESAIAIWRRCMASGKWEGYAARIYYPDPPGYAVAQWEEREISQFGIKYEVSELWHKPGDL